jgi:3-oxoacyl-[acyl-carrier protein] reductase
MDNRSLFSQQKVLITGGSRGMGKAIAQLLLQQGANVVITGSYVRKGWWDNIVKCDFQGIDFNDDSQCTAFFQEISQQNIRYLVNCAGVINNTDFEKLSQQELLKIHQVNFVTPMSLIKALIPSMKKSKFGRIVNIASIAALQHREGSSAYATSKAALITSTRALALEFAPFNILINAISPGYTDTDMMGSLDKDKKQHLINQVPLKRLCTPREIASVVLFLLNSENKYITGHNLIIDGGVTLKQ